MRTDPASLPDTCGVYLFKTDDGRVLYVGKAINIRSRVRSHLNDHINEKEIRLRERAEVVDWIATGSELEALVLEDTLIKRYKPRFNVRLKDDKSYPYLLLTNDDFPAVHQIRGLKPGMGEFFGPHSDPVAVRRSLRWLRKLFPVRSCRRDLSKSTRPCLEYHLGRCLAPCTGRVRKEDYQLVVNGMRSFLSGRREEVISTLEKEMWSASSNEDFEKAGMIRDIVRGLRRIRQAQKVVLVNGGDLDAVHVNDNGTATTIVKVREGNVIDVSTFFLENVEPLSGITGDLLSSLYYISSSIPPKIVVDKVEMGREQRDELEMFLSEKRGGRVRIVRPRGGEIRSLMEMAARNMSLYEAEQRKRSEGEKTLTHLREKLELSTIPLVIEGFDISHLGGTGTVASMVQFVKGKPRKAGYRRFKIHSDRNDDLLSMKEAVHRRYRRILDQDGEMPDMILIDGGTGQLKAAMKALSELGLKDRMDVAAIAKREEVIFRPGRSIPVKLERSDLSLKLLQRIRDEAHRFAISYQRKLREKNITVLTSIEGVGEARARKLLTCFDSLEAIIEGGPGVIRERCSIPHNVSRMIVAFLKNERKG